MTESHILQNLSDVQKSAVTHGHGPLVIFAGAGSGKTRVLTHRIAWLIDEMGVSPYRILAVTFTNKAAAEMKGRVGALLPGVGETVWVSTFHSACVRILRRDAQRIGYQSNFVIYDDADQRSLIKNILKRLNIDDKQMDPRRIRSCFDEAKNNALDLEEVNHFSGGFKDKYVQVCETYTAELKKNNAFDFGDLIVKAIDVLKSSESVREYYNERLQHILVDEFQDTNIAQYKLLSLLLGDHKNICVVGDDDQSIYRWRGAQIANILNFEKEYSGAKVVILGENYRSTKTIIEAASKVIEKNAGRKPKELFTQNPIGELITLYRAQDEYEEARFTVKKTREIHEKHGVPYKSMAIFYRTNAQSRVFEEELSKYGIPFQVIGGMRFYDRKEIKDVLAYLRVVINPADSICLKRIINVPTRGIGKVTVAKIDEVSANRNITFLRAARVLLNEELLPKGALLKLAAFIKIIDELTLDAQSCSPREMVRQSIERSGYRRMLEEDKSVEAMTRRENLDELMVAVGEFEKEMPEEGLSFFLEQVALVSDPDMYDDNTDTVNLMTIHCAKGLEFPAVFVVGMEEGLFPHSRSLESLEEMEEERRLCYVAMTRAQRFLHILSAQKRKMFGGRPVFTIQSRFIDDIPEPLIKTDSVFSGRSFAQNTYSNTSKEIWNNNSSKTSQNFDGYTPPQRKTEPGLPDEPTIDYSDSQINDGPALRVGMRVRHPKLGKGIIMSLEGSGDYATAKVKFDNSQVKKLMLKFARLVLA